MRLSLFENEVLALVLQRPYIEWLPLCATIIYGIKFIIPLSVCYLEPFGKIPNDK